MERRVASAAAAAGASLLAVSVPAAEAWRFEPALLVATTYTDNVQYLSEASNVFYLTGFQESQGDFATVLGAEIPIERSWRTGKVSLTYRPWVAKHDSLPELDHFEQSLNLNLQTAAGRASTWEFSVTGERTQLQGRATEPITGDPAADIFLVPRTDRDALRANAKFSSQWSARWGWSLSAGAFRETYTPIDDVTSEVGDLALEDRQGFGGGLRFARSVSEGNSWGVGYQLEHYDLDLSGGEDVHRLGFDVQRRISAVTSFSGGLGGYWRTADETSLTGDALDAEDMGLYLTCAYSRRFRRTTLALDGSFYPTSGGALRGTSIDFSAGATLSGALSNPRWTWTMAARAGRRDPADALLPTLDTTTLGGTIEWRPRDSFGLRFSATNVRQRSSDPLYLQGDFTVLGTGFVWYPMGSRTMKT